MKRLILYFLLTLGAVWLGVTIYHYPGYVLILYRQWAVETTTWFLVLLLLATFLFLHLFLNLLQGTIQLPKRIKTWWRQRKEHKAIKRLHEGYSDLLLGKFKRAEKNLLKSAKNKQLSFINYIILAQGADLQRATTKRNYYIQQATKRGKKEDYAANLMQVRFYLENNQLQDASTALLKLKAEYPKTPYFLKLLTETYLKLHDWFHLQQILGEIKKTKLFTEDQYVTIEKQVYLHPLLDHFFTDFSQVQTLWNKVPKQLRHDSDILIAYATQLNRWNRGNEAEELIRKELKKHFSSRLMEYYVTTRSEQPAKQIALGEQYLKENAEDAASIRAMGILCLRNRLWGQARDYLENSLKLQITAETYSALGYVYEKLGEGEKALNYYRKGLSYIAPFTT
jgi:HemY protein